MYYLNSRYYNPDWGRFINADALCGSVGELLSHNIFAYCKNDPINKFDPNGYREMIATNWYEENQIINAISTKTPPPSETGYKSPKNPDKAKKRIPAPGARGETGWLDKKGNVWVPDIDMDGGEGWRRHYPDGSHDHVYPNGKVRSHNIVEGFDSQDSRTLAYLAIGGVAVWTVVKWGGAIVLAPETGGASLAGAAILP